MQFRSDARCPGTFSAVSYGSVTVQLQIC
jgi:hypothetical protein